MDAVSSRNQDSLPDEPIGLEDYDYEEASAILNK